MNKTIFDTSIRRLMAQLTPIVLRQPGFTTLTDRLASPLDGVLAQVRTAHRDVERRTLYNGQTRRLQMCLNDALDPDQRRILVVDGNALSDPVPYALLRTKPGTATPLERGASPALMLMSRKSITQPRYDFYVVIPDDLLPDGADTASTAIRTDKTNTLAALTNTYKLPSKRWRLLTQTEYRDL